MTANTDALVTLKTDEDANIHINTAMHCHKNEGGNGWMQ